MHLEILSVQYSFANDDQMVRNMRHPYDFTSLLAIKTEVIDGNNLLRKLGGLH